jgi:drug/metabolite transporter (DMT)-like permease
LPFVLLVAVGLQLMSAAEVASIAPAAMPVFVGIMGWVVLVERQGKARWLGYGAIVVGLISLVEAGASSVGRDRHDRDRVCLAAKRPSVRLALPKRSA